MTAGCLGGATSDERATSIANDTMDEMGAVDGLSWSVHGAAHAERGDRTASINIEGEGRVNYQTDRALVSVAGDGDRTWIALVNRTTYGTCPFGEADGMPARWYPDGDLPDGMSFRDAVAVASPHLLDISTIQYDGNRTIDGTLHHRIALEPDPVEYTEYKDRAMYPGHDGSQFSGQSYDEVTATLLVANDTHRIRSMTVTERFTQDGVTVETRLDYEFEYGSPPPIEFGRVLPDEDRCFQ
jgi:hypothetical protein